MWKLASYVLVALFSEYIARISDLLANFANVFRSQTFGFYILIISFLLQSAYIVHYFQSFNVGLYQTLLLLFIIPVLGLELITIIFIKRIQLFYIIKVCYLIILSTLNNDDLLALNSFAMLQLFHILSGSVVYKSIRFELFIHFLAFCIFAFHTLLLSSNLRESVFILIVLCFMSCFWIRWWLSYVWHVPTELEICQEKPRLYGLRIAIQSSILPRWVYYFALAVGLMKIVPMTITNLAMVVLFTVPVVYNEYRSRSFQGFLRVPHRLFIIFIASIIVYTWVSEMFHGNKDELNYVIPIVSDIAILNIASLYILCQLNYNKFGSVVILRILLSSIPLLITTFFPVILTVISVEIKRSTYYPFIPPVLLMASFGSVILLIFSFRTVVDTNSILERLLAKITAKDFENYRVDLVNNSETRIDAILKLNSGIAKRNEIAIARSFYFNLFCWFSKNIERISNNGKSARKSLSRFKVFFRILHDHITKNDSYQLQKNYTEAVRYVFDTHVSRENYLSFEIIIKSLLELVEQALRQGKDMLASEMHAAIYTNTSRIFYSLERAEPTNGFYHTGGNDFQEFSNIYVSPIRKLISVAIENRNIDFLKNLHPYQDLFSHSPEDDYSKWDAKVVSIYIKTRYDIESKNSFLLKHGHGMFHPKMDFELFFAYSAFASKRNYTYRDSILKYASTSLIATYAEAIENDRVRSDFDFDLLYTGMLIGCNNNDVQEFSLAFTLYMYVFEVFLANEVKNKRMRKTIINSIWLRIEQARRSASESKLIQKEIEKKLRVLERRYPVLKSIEKYSPEYSKVMELDILNDLNIEKLDQKNQMKGLK